ncbi:uncharacterized protein TRAVEDRAFT_136271, partial [Trametes versicolor FP-101664 SS1]
GIYNFYPPTWFCLARGCTYAEASRAGQQRALVGAISLPVVYFTRDHGPVAAMSHSARCGSCGIRYYPNYYVDGTQSRVYYQDIPPAIHVATHIFVEVALCTRFANSAACACARIYNLEHAAALKRFPADWSNDPTLTSILVGDAFFLLGLLHDKKERSQVLVLNNQGEQASRLDSALQARTASLVGPGRESWNHLCDKCCVTRNVNGQHAVMDGISIGRPCCNIHDCQEPLQSQRDRYCQQHQAYNNVCVVVGCDSPATTDHQTCPEPSHRALEDPSGRSALFVLRRRLERLRAASLEDNGEGISEELIDIDADGECPSKSDEGNSKPRACFGRRRTHNEQLVVATCGVLLGRATMFGSEGLNGTRKHVIAINDHHFDHCAMPVDPFHAKTKHKDSDAFCGQHCNAALFPDLLVGNKWRFNSSAAKMTNAWFGGFQAIVQEMRAARYDFFLDEMIRIQNEIIIADLHKAKAFPTNAPRELLLMI